MTEQDMKDTLRAIQIILNLRGADDTTKVKAINEIMQTVRVER